MGKKEPSFPQFVLLVKVVFTGTSGKNVFTGKPGLPEQRFTTLPPTNCYTVETGYKVAICHRKKLLFVRISLIADLNFLVRRHPYMTSALRGGG